MAGSDPDEEPVPKLPRGRGLKLSGAELFRIAVTLSMLVAIVILARPCGNAVSHFVMSFGSAPKKPAATKPEDYEHLKPGMSDQELKAAIERAKQKAKEAGSAAPIDPLPIPSPSDSSTPPASGSGSGASTPAGGSGSSTQ